MKLARLLPRVPDERSTHLALGWLLLASAAVAASSLFAIMIVMARVPGLGALFPGTEFYRVALTLHVDLSQWVWFMAFAAMLWSLAASRTPRHWQWAALGLGVGGALLMALSPAFGAIRPVMSNYIPVLDSPWFLAGLGIYGVAVLIAALAEVLDGGWFRPAAGGDEWTRIFPFGLFLAAVVVLVALAILAYTHAFLPAAPSRHAYFETLFWGAGHVWQFCLTTLMLLAWLGLCAPRLELPSVRLLQGLLMVGVLPALAAPLLLPLGPASPEYFLAYTRLMQWGSWQVPVFLGALLLLRHWRAGLVPATGLSLSMLLLVAGVLLGALIGGQTTLVTAHYHGTIGAVTLAFMGLTYGVLPVLGCTMPGRAGIDWQLRLYSYGILLMMTGLAGAGLMGAPRKMAGNVGMEFSIEAASRMIMGLGGSLATVGILMFLVLVLRHLWPGVSLRMVRHG